MVSYRTRSGLVLVGYLELIVVNLHLCVVLMSIVTCLAELPALRSVLTEL